MFAIDQRRLLAGMGAALAALAMSPLRVVCEAVPRSLS